MWLRLRWLGESAQPNERSRPGVASDLGADPISAARFIIGSCRPSGDRFSLLVFSIRAGNGEPNISSGTSSPDRGATPRAPTELQRVTVSLMYVIGGGLEKRGPTAVVADSRHPADARAAGFARIHDSSGRGLRLVHIGGARNSVGLHAIR